MDVHGHFTSHCCHNAALVTTISTCASSPVLHPSQEDYRRAVEEFDEKAFCGFRLICREVRNIYVSEVLSALILQLVHVGLSAP